MNASIHGSVEHRLGDILLPAMDCLRVGISVFNGADQLIYCNEHFRYIYRSFDSVDALMGLTFTDVLRLQLRHGEIAGEQAIRDPEGYIAQRLKVRRDIRSAPVEQRLTDGRWISIKERPIPSGGYIGVWQDITELKRARLATEDAVESTTDGFALWDQADRLTLSNPAFTELHRTDSGSPQPRERFGALLRRAMKDGVFTLPEGETPEDWIEHRLRRDWDRRDELVVQHRNGRWYSIKDRRTRDGGSATIVTDITDVKENELELTRRGKTLERTVHELEMVQTKLEENGQELAELAEQLQLAKVMAEQSSASKSAFLSNMSHELRTPLNAIIGFAEVISGEMVGPVGNQKYREYATDIHSAGTHLLALINDILDLAKIESGRLELHRSLLPAAETVASVVRMVEAKATEKGQHFEIEIHPDCQDVFADDRAFRQALLNLVSNAVKFTPDGGRLGVRVEPGEDGAVDLSVWDTGIGIQAKDLPRVMQRFEQVRDPMTSDNKGTGLGLAIVQSLMELHGGRFFLQSTLGTGTTATVSFPPRDEMVRATEYA
jgi:two-component system cell cycle sensor histidine kinase PleC